MELKSSVFTAGGMIPKKYTCDGPDVSPPLSWSDVPAGAKSLALIADDPDAPMGTWVHWVAWNIPPNAHGLEEGMPKKDSLPNGMKQGTTDFRTIGYGGPRPASSTGRYFFNLYRPNPRLHTPPDTPKEASETRTQTHLLHNVVPKGKKGRTDVPRPT